MIPLIDVKWKIIVGAPHYYVSNEGKVLSCARLEEIKGRHPNPYLRKRRTTILKPRINNSGYYQVSLPFQEGTKRKSIHRLVAEAFIPNPENKPEVNHIDGDRLNNRYDNLEWCTRSENSLHSTKVLKKNVGDNSNSSKLTSEQVLQIADRLAKGETQTSLAKEFNVSNHAIYRIQHGYNWSHLTGIGKEVNL